jgi:DNA-directed RNA polymerase subunit E'/Rpb7
MGDSYVYPGEGSAHIKVQFRLVIFKPFVGEVIQGTVIDSNEEGLQGKDLFEI